MSPWCAMLTPMPLLKDPTRAPGISRPALLPPRVHCWFGGANSMREILGLRHVAHRVGEGAECPALEEEGCHADGSHHVVARPAGPIQRPAVHGRVRTIPIIPMSIMPIMPPMSSPMRRASDMTNHMGSHRGRTCTRPRTGCRPGARCSRPSPIPTGSTTVPRSLARRPPRMRVAVVLRPAEDRAEQREGEGGERFIRRSLGPAGRTPTILLLFLFPRRVSRRTPGCAAAATMRRG